MPLSHPPSFTRRRRRPPPRPRQRLREICDKHGLLLIFDEVITGFGRLGKGFGAEYFDVVPDMITTAKGLTNGTVPAGLSVRHSARQSLRPSVSSGAASSCPCSLPHHPANPATRPTAGATFVQKHVYDAFMEAPGHKGQGVIELFHGYTYSGHPLAMAAGLATLDVYKEQGLFERAAALEGYWQEALHSLKGHPHVVDIRNCGLMGAVELAPRPGNKVGQRAFQVFTTAFHKGVLVRVTGDTIALSPPLIIDKAQIDQIVTTLSQAINEVA